MRIPQLITFILALLFLSACSNQNHYRFYEGDSLPKSHLVSIVVPEAVDVLSIDGKKMDNRLGNFKRDNITIDLTPGHHKIELRYSQIWDIDADNHEKITSPEVYLEANLDADTYHLQYPKLHTINDARKFAQSAQIKLVKSSTQETISQTDYTHPAEALSLKAVSSKDSSSVVTSVVPPTASTVAVAPVVKPDMSTIMESTPGQDMTLENLKHWWKQASREQKAAFILWTQQQ